METHQKQYNLYFEKYRYLRHHLLNHTEMLKHCFLNNKKIFEIYTTTIYPAIQLPYVFSDHKNKTFINQYNFLKNRYPELWKIEDPAKTFTQSQNSIVDKKSYINKLPAELHKIIYDYAKSDWIIECIAIASHVSFYWNSD